MPVAPLTRRAALIPALGLILMPALSNETPARQSGQESEAAARPQASASPVASTTLESWTVLAYSDGRIVLLDVRGETRREWKSPIRHVRSLAIDPAGVPAAGDAAAGRAATPAILAAGPGENANTSTVVSMKGESGEAIARVEVPGDVVHLLAVPGGRKAFVVTGRSSAVTAARQGRDDRWGIATVDLAGDAPPAGMGIEGPVLAAALSPQGDRIYLACPDRIRTFNTNPLRSSWQFRSPGRNQLVVASGTAGDILVARGSQIARLNPEKLPGRDPNTGSFPTDDAMLVVPVPFEPAHLTSSPGGDLAAALDAPGTQLALLDLAGGRLLGSRDVPPAAAAVLHTDRDAVVMLSIQGADVSELRFPNPRPAAAAVAKPGGEPAGQPAGTAVPPSSAEPGAAPAAAAATTDPSHGSEPASRSSPQDAPDAAGEAPAETGRSAGKTAGSPAGTQGGREGGVDPGGDGRSGSPPETPAGKDSASPTAGDPNSGTRPGTQPEEPAPSPSPSPAQPEAPAPAPASQAAAPGPEPTPAPPAGEQPGAGQPSAPLGEKSQAPQSATSPNPQPATNEAQEQAPGTNAPSEPSLPDVIRGRILGEASLVKEVVFYGPNSILKEKARVAPMADGTFSLPLPPPGRYRILLTGTGGAQLSYSPVYYQIEVASVGISGIDFKVVGTIPGHLVP